MSSKPHLIQGPVLSLLFSATLWGVIWYPLRLLNEHGLNGLWSSVVSYGVALLAGALYAWRHALNWREDKARLALMALAAGWCNVAFVMAVIDGTVVRVLLLFYLSPVWAVLLGRWLLGERASRMALAVVGVALVGALVMLWDERLGLPWPQVAADWLALSSGFGFALSNVLVRQMREVSLPAKTLASWVGVVLVAVVWIGLGGHTVPVVTAPTVLGAVALGLFGIIAMTLAVQYGVTHMPIHRSSVILLFELVAGAVSSQWLAHELISVREMIGGALIVVAAYIAARPTPER
jgi:drug/metabolite transporter (DMT)-like permease